MKAVLTQTAISALIKGHQYIIPRDNEKFNDAVKAFKNNSEDEFLEVYQNAFPSKAMVAVEALGLQVKDGVLMDDGVEVHNTLATRILDFHKLGLDYQPLVNFYKKVKENPSFKVINQLFDFLSHKNLPIDEDGDFYAYKAVDRKFYSKTRGNLKLLQGTALNGRIYNGVGETIECVRGEVDDNEINECSSGLHVGSLEYSGPNAWFYRSGNKVLIVKVNPKDVVSVPKDGTFHKVRTCKYSVVELYSQPMSSTLVNQEEGPSKNSQFCEWCGFVTTNGLCDLCEQTWEEEEEEEDEDDEDFECYHCGGIVDEYGICYCDDYDDEDECDCEEC